MKEILKLVPTNPREHELPPDYKYKALYEGLYIAQSSLHGQGVFTTKELPEGLVLGMSHIPHPHFEDGLIRTPLGGFINHKANGNITFKKMGGYMYGITLRFIYPAEELTANYYQTDCAKYTFDETRK